MKHYFFKRVGVEEQRKVPKLVKKRLEFKWGMLWANFWKVLSFVIYIIVFLIGQIAAAISNFKYFPKKWKDGLSPLLSSFYFKLIKKLDYARPDSISRLDLIEIAIRNMKAKKTRTLVTIGGMTIGIAAIVFLVSVGYGVQKLVVSRVARLEEMKQTDVSVQAGSKLKINDKTLSDIKEISGVGQVLPLIAVVGKVSYQNSVSDMAVYGVTADYLKKSAIKPSSGKIFESNEIVKGLSSVESGEVAGAEDEIAEYGKEIGEKEFSIKEGEWVKVRKEPATSSKIIGYAKRTEGTSTGTEVWGGSYISDGNCGSAGKDENGKLLGKWIKAKVPLWEKIGSEYTQMQDTDSSYLQEEGYFAQVNLLIADAAEVNTAQTGSLEQTNILGLKTENGLEVIEIASEAGIIAPPEVKQIDLPYQQTREAVVNKAMLKILGIKENEGLGKVFSVSFVVVSDLLSDNKENIQSLPVEYKIIGITPDEKTPIFYVPFTDLRALGIENFSQAKTVAKEQNDLPKIRKQIEAMGYVTRSASDTVAQINNLFKTAKTILALLGGIALAVAALGMFNTLTVSLLERTREVGLLKAMGMKSEEVKELFLTESMIMGFSGGILGILTGFLLGKLLGMALSFMTVFRGAGVIDISSLPFGFVLEVIFLSLLVGLLTGIYPAKRATKISALNALRYE